MVPDSQAIDSKRRLRGMERSGKVLCGRWSKDYRNKCQKKKEEEEGREEGEEGLHFWRGGTWEGGLGDLGGHFVC